MANTVNNLGNKPELSHSAGVIVFADSIRSCPPVRLAYNGIRWRQVLRYGMQRTLFSLRNHVRRDVTDFGAAFCLAPPLSLDDRLYLDLAEARGLRLSPAYSCRCESRWCETHKVDATAHQMLTTHVVSSGGVLGTEKALLGDEPTLGSKTEFRYSENRQSPLSALKSAFTHKHPRSLTPRLSRYAGMPPFQARLAFPLLRLRCLLSRPGWPSLSSV
jgi:hypothetical protein